MGGDRLAQTRAREVRDEAENLPFAAAEPAFRIHVQDGERALRVHRVGSSGGRPCVASQSLAYFANT